MPPNAAKRSRMAWVKSLFAGRMVASAERKISRASCSIERPWWAARTRSRALVFSSSCRIVNVAMLSMLALLAWDAKTFLQGFPQFALGSFRKNHDLVHGQPVSGEARARNGEGNR